MAKAEAQKKESVLEAKDEIYKKFYKTLKDKGVLFIGSTEQIINHKELGYDISANIFAFCMFCMTMSPTWVKKVLYRIR